MWCGCSLQQECSARVEILRRHRSLLRPLSEIESCRTSAKGRDVNQRLRAFLWTLLLLAIAASGYAQGWALPAKTPETPVACTGCPNAGVNSLTVGYKTPVATFTGRYLDSSNTSEWFKPFRTARAKFVLTMPALDRIYFRYGDGSVASYKLSNFFTRLEANEKLAYWAPDGMIYRTQSGGTPEVWLKWDTWFNPELGSGWKTNTVDGSLRMTFFDVDDKGYVYIASTLYGWGIVKDEFGTLGGVMTTQVQKYPAAKTDSAPNMIAVVKGATRYYAILGRQDMWDVTDRKNPVKLTTSSVPALYHFAKSAGADRIAIIDDTSTLTINTADGLATGATPLFTASGFQDVTSDGTNFFALRYPSGIVPIVPSGNTYVTQAGTAVDPKFGGASTIKYGDGYLVLNGSDNGGAWDARVYKVGANLAITPILVEASPADSTYPSYFRNYYGIPPANNYVVPGYINMLDGTVVKLNGRTYLIICAKGLGDVYELSGGDSITVTNDGGAGTINPNTPAASNAKTFFGDPILFTAKSQSPNISTVIWNFGNPEAGTQKNSTQTSLINQPIPYQYSNLTRAGLGAKTVSASALNDAGVRGTTTATLEAPVARFAIAGTNPRILFTQPNANSPAPVVVDDVFVDASDGRVESHYDSWTFDGGLAVKSTPAEPMTAGGCGTHSVSFTSIYGPYSGSGPSLTGGNYVAGLDAANGAVGYIVRPFAAALEIAGSTPTSVTFRSTSRFTSNSLVLTPAHVAALSYTWDLIGPSGVPLTASVTGTGTTAIPTFVVPKATLSAAPAGSRVRLLLRTTASFTGTSCAGLEESVALSAPLNAPDPRVTQGGDCQGAPCTFTATSISGIDTAADGWTYQWQVLASNGSPADSSMFAATGATTPVFTPSFFALGTYTVKLTVTNSIGQKEVLTPVNITVVTTRCATMTDNSFVATFSGAQGCTPYSQCQQGEALELRADAPLLGGYDPNCSPHTYTWYLNGVQIATGSPASYNATSSGSLTVVISNGTQSRTYPPSGSTLTLRIATVTPPPNPCGTFTAANLFVSYTGNQGCTAANACKNGETITFKVDPYLYSFTCAPHQFSWNFGDGTTGQGQQVTHAYTTTGAHAVSVTVTNQYQPAGATKSLSVTTNDSTPGQCPTLTANSIAISYAGASSGCAFNTAAPCNNNESINFDVFSSTGYDFNCSTHNFTWDFGDGATATGKSASHAYAASGQHVVKVSVTNANTTTPVVRQITVTTGSTTCGTITSTSLYIDYHNAISTCGPLAGACTTGEVLNFTVKQFGVYDMNCAAHTFDWDFGDGSPHVATKDVAHQYAAAGTYTSICTVNNGTQTVTLQQTVTINTNVGGNPEVQIDPSITPVATPPNTYRFTASVTGAPADARYVWSFGDGQEQTGLTATHTYATAGRYTATLSVYSAGGSLLKTQAATVGGSGKRRSVRH